jgi:hypothetical protein
VRAPLDPTAITTRMLTASSAGRRSCP